VSSVDHPVVVPGQGRRKTAGSFSGLPSGRTHGLLWKLPAALPVAGKPAFLAVNARNPVIGYLSPQSADDDYKNFS
jgi:hypothetical protein